MPRSCQLIAAGFFLSVCVTCSSPARGEGATAPSASTPHRASSRSILCTIIKPYAVPYERG